MSKDLPHCPDFVIETIRSIRQNPSNIKDGNAGAGLHRVWNVAKDVYSELEFRNALNHLLHDEVLVAIARMVHCDEAGTFGPIRLQRIGCIRSDWPLSRKRWFVDENHELIQGKLASTQSYITVKELRLYVVADGLPRTKQRVLATKDNVTAGAILASLKSRD